MTSGEKPDALAFNLFAASIDDDVRPSGCS